MTALAAGTRPHLSISLLHSQEMDLFPAETKQQREEKKRKFCRCAAGDIATAAHLNQGAAIDTP